MIKTYGYFDFLKFHLLVLCLPVLFAGLAFFNSIVLFANDMYFLYRVLTDQLGDPGAWGTALFILKKMIKYGFMFFLLNLLIQICKSGLFFLPYLAWTNKLKVRSVLRIGTSRLLPVFMVLFAANLLFGIVGSILAFIPFLNLIAVIALPFLAALSSILFDYLFSTNLLLGRPLLYRFSQRFRELFVSEKRFFGYAAMLTLSYFFLASVFVKPFIQKEICSRFSTSIAEFRRSA